MKENNKKLYENIYKAGQLVGLNKNDISTLLKEKSLKIEQSYYLGPKPYPGGFYSTISIKSFQ